MPLLIVREDITKMKVDAIVTATNVDLIGDGGADGAIHRAAGPLLEDACRKLGGCQTGEAVLTPGFNLHARYIVHTVGPIWRGGKHNERALLTSCYAKSLQLALDNGCESIAFPLISSGIYGYPKADAFAVAVQTIQSFLLTQDMTVYLIVYDKEAVRVSRKLFADIEEYIDDRYVEKQGKVDFFSLNYPQGVESRFIGSLKNAASILHEETMPDSACDDELSFDETECKSAPAISAFKLPDKKAAKQRQVESEALKAPVAPKFAKESLDDRIKQLDESFTEMLMRKIDESGMTDPEVYRRANVNRRLFSKIRKDLHYHPRKQVALAFAVALRLPMAETQDLLRKAGLAINPSEKFDLIVEYFIEQGHYDVDDINVVLFKYDQTLLGAASSE